jgi:23S rRNA (uracil1939-C5)-methyltransferase
VDPPRKGLNADAIEAIDRMDPRRLVYISCDPATLARDVALLKEKGFVLQNALAADLFPRCSHVETVVLLGRKQVSDYLHIAVNTEDLETDVGRIYTNDDIKQYIEEKYGFKVHSAYIGQVREKLGIREHENYNDSHTSPRKPTVCPEEKEAAIVDALKHFGLIG